MATVTLTPDAYYQLEGIARWYNASYHFENLHITEINPTQRKVYIASDGGAVYCVLVHYKINTSSKYVYSAINKVSLPALTPTPSASTNNRVDVAAASFDVSAFQIGDYYEDHLLNRTSIGRYNPDPTWETLQSQYSTLYQPSDDFWVYLHPYMLRTPTYFTNSMPATLTYTEITPNFTLLPSAGYLDADSQNTIKLVYANTGKNVIKPYSAESGTFYYKKESESQYSTLAYTNNAVTIPSGTLEEQQTYTAYATFTTQDSTTGNTSNYTYTTTDTIGTTTGQTPNNSIEYGNVTFTWTYRNSTGTAQYAYDLDISDDGTTYTTVLSHVVTSATTATYNVSTAGGKYWRVRGYNQNDVAGNYSTPLYFVNNIPPSPPVITNITGAGRLTVTWAADNQSAYEVEVYNGDTRAYDSTVVYTADTTHLINEYLPNGTYTIKVKTINIYGHTSDYATTVYTITNVGSLNVSGSYEDGTATLSYPDGYYAKYYIQRDGATIAKTTEKTYSDMFMNGTATYTVIAVNSDDSYAIGTATVTGTVPFTRFVDLEGNVYDISKRWQQRIGVQVSNEAEYDTALYLGAKRPAHTFGTGRIRRYAIAFTYEGDYTVFIGKVLRYMDIYGNADFVVVPNINEVEARYGNELTASLEVTDYNEGITYDL